MSRWNDQFESHAFRATWSSLKTLLDESDLEKNGDELAIKEIARLKKVTAYVDSVLAQIDPELMPMAHLDALNTHITNCLNQLNSFISNQSIGHLHNANTNIDSVIVLLSQTPFNVFAQQKGGLAKAAAAYAETLDQHLIRLNESVDREIEAVKGNVTNIQTTLSANDKALVDLKAQLQTVTQTIQKQTAEFNTQFQSSEQARAVKFDASATKLQEKADKEFELLATKAGAILEALGKFHEDASKVFGVVVNTLQAGAYSSYANEEKKTANILRWSAISLMVLGVGVLVVPEVIKIVREWEAYTLNWMTTVGRIPYSLILFVPAFYLARESNKHRNTEVVNRRRELILSTIDPYLALLDDAKGQQIKLDIAKGIFSEGPQPASDSAAGESANVIAQIANLVKQVKGK